MPPRSSATRPQPANPAWFILVFSVLLGLLYLPSLSHPFIFDDHTAILTNETLKHPLSFEAFWGPRQTTSAGRPLLNFSLALNHAVSGLNPWSYRLANILLHCANAWLLFLCANGCMDLFAPRTRRSVRPRAAILAAVAIWMLHPIQTESVTYVVQRAESLAVFFQLLCFLAWTRHARSPSPGLAVGATLAAAAAMLSKENSAMLPLFIAAGEFLLHGARGILRRERLAILLPVASTWGILAALMITGPRDESAGFGLSMTWHGYFLGQVRILWHYLFLILWPAKLTLDYGWPQGVPEARTMLYLALNLAAGLAGTWGFFVRRRLWGALILAWFGVLAPTSSIAPIADLCFEHRVYLAMFFPLFAVTRVIAKLGIRPLALATLSACAALCLATLIRNHDYRTEIAIYTNSTRKSPDNWRPHSNLAHLLVQAGDPQTALVHARRAVELAPAEGEAHFNLGNALSDLGDIAGARAAYLEAAARSDKPAPELNNLALIEIDLGNRAEGRRLLEEAVRIDPAFADALNNLGTLHAEEGRIEEARQCFQRAIAADPLHEGAVENLKLLNTAP